MTAPKTIGKYEIAEKIGVGGFGVVYKAWDPYIQRWVALKTCAATDDETTQRFFREAQLAGALQHPNITLIFDFGIEAGTPYFVQEFLSGTDLDDVFDQHHLSLESILAILLQVCNGLDFAHSRGIIHRDIKPANVRLLEDGTVKIMDFGIARSLETESRLTQTGVALGTAGYLAPEQLAGKPLDQRTDLFSLGVLAYELVAGQRPFAGPNLSNVIYQILNQTPVPVRQRNPECPEDLERAIMKALAKDPDERYRTVREFGQAIKEVLAGLTHAGPSRRVETTTAILRGELGKISRSPKAELTAPTQLSALPLDRLPTTQAPEAKPRRRRWVVPVVGAAVLVIAAVAAWTALGPGRENRRATTPAAALVPPTPTAAAQPTPVPAPTPLTAGLPVMLTLFVDPPSEVEVDGRSLGKVQSTEIALDPGPHLFRQRIAGYREQTLPVSVSATTHEVRLQLPPFGLLSVFNDFGVSVRDTVVLLDGKTIGTLPLQERKVEAGEHLLEVRWPDGGLLRQSVSVPAEGHQRLTVSPQS